MQKGATGIALRGSGVTPGVSDLSGKGVPARDGSGRAATVRQRRRGATAPPSRVLKGARGMRVSRIARGLLLAGATLWVASAASAVPVSYFFTGGEITITATVDGGLVAGPVTIDLTGTSVTVDEGALTLNSISFSAGSTGSVAISPSYLGYTSINIDFASITGTGGTLTAVDPGPPAEYGYSIGPVMVSGQFDAVNVIPANNINDMYFGFSNASGNGTIFVDPNLGELELNGITLGSIDPDGPGGVSPLLLKGDITFTGVPEPGTAALVGLGIAGLAGLRRSRRA